MEECYSAREDALVKNPRKLIDAFDIEVGATLGLSTRAGFNPGQFLDFLLGWFGVDIAGDDTNAESAPVPEAPEQPTP